MAGGRPKKSDIKPMRRNLIVCPKPEPLPKMFLTSKQAKAVSGLKAVFSHRITKDDRWEWVWQYVGLDLMLLVTVFKRSRPQKHHWEFGSRSVQFTTLGEVADVLIRMEKEGERARFQMADAV